MNPSRIAADLSESAQRSPWPVEQRVEQVSSLISDLTAAADGGDVAFENRLVEARLGIAGSLFTALRCKHAPTAAHSLRVALGCSSWSFALELPDEARDELEVAALLHDVGKIAVPDRVLLKPGALHEDEAALMDRHRLAGLDILRSCCSSPTIVEIVRHAPGWYDGSRHNYPLSGRELPLGARMLTIIDAFDSMTTDQVYRHAMSRERALNELFACAGTQFDPDLVRLFAELQDSEQLAQKVARRWLKGLDPQANSLWQSNALAPPVGQFSAEALFQDKLLDNMHDGVVFVDSNLQVTLWNHGAERITGVPSAGVQQRNWSPSLLGMCDDRGYEVDEKNCPVAYAIQTGTQSLRRMMITGRNQTAVAIDLHAVPVVSTDGVTHGAAILLHDATDEASLEKRCQNLHERATKDPLTQVANRAEFDRTHQLFVTAHLERRLPCSLIICDIDHFKHINDNYGHPAGDEALKSFAQLLKSQCRPGDLVARYGGEEFVILCADCNNATAAQRADQMRRAISQLPQPSINGRSITVSFGVTEVQDGDSPDTMLRRADRALLEAKQRGRNTVVQLGAGISQMEEKPTKRGWFAKRLAPDLLLEKSLSTPVPLKVAIEKLRGFVADHFAEITSIDGEKVYLKMDGEKVSLLRRGSDRAVPFLIELHFTEEKVESLSKGNREPGGQITRTKIYVAIRPRKDRDRRRADAAERAGHVLASIKSYLMATEEDFAPEAGALRRASSALVPWLRKG